MQVYSLDKTSDYRHQFDTTRLTVPYYVKDPASFERQHPAAGRERCAACSACFATSTRSHQGMLCGMCQCHLHALPSTYEGCTSLVLQSSVTVAYAACRGMPALTACRELCIFNTCVLNGHAFWTSAQAAGLAGIDEN